MALPHGGRTRMRVSVNAAEVAGRNGRFLVRDDLQQKGLNEIRSAFSLLDHEVEYITYCHSGRRSAAAAFLLARNGFKACRLSGSMGKKVES